MVSPWQSPLPLEEHKTSRVVVYFYSDKLGLWIPIVFFQLIEAIALHHKGLFNGVEFFVFPPDLDPCSWGDGGMGNFMRGKGEMPNARCPMPNCPMTAGARSSGKPGQRTAGPMPHAPCPIPNN